MSRSNLKEGKKRLEILIQETDLETLITMRGQIDEDTDFAQLNAAHNKNLIFDLGGVELINSVGIRGWVNWMKVNRERNFTFRNCSKPITDQINVLQGFLPPVATVESFYVPFICENCDRHQQVLYRKGIEFERATADKKTHQLRPPQVKCSSCGQQMVQDVLEAKYFSFLKYR